MTIARFGTQLGYSLFGVLVLIGMSPSPARAQEGHVHAPASQHREADAEEKNQTSAFVRIVRESTERFRDVAVAQAEGYALQFGCVSGSDVGAMGMHFVNGSLVADGKLDVRRPQIVIYEPTSNGHLRLIGADYLVLAGPWNATHAAPPQLMGQLFHLFESPNRFGLPPFYTLHVWAWKENPNGTFVNWHPQVSCDGFTGTNP
jgi:hypothetical protein